MRCAAGLGEGVEGRRVEVVVVPFLAEGERLGTSGLDGCKDIGRFIGQGVLYGGRAREGWVGAQQGWKLVGGVVRRGEGAYAGGVGTVELLVRVGRACEVTVVVSKAALVLTGLCADEGGFGIGGHGVT